ncbi:MAG: GGDEF domain-containing protein [Ruminococcus sp.]|nr:GGDEF domain-containing protein [Ruminococcus sp.]
MSEKIINIVVMVAGIDEEYQNNIISGINAYVKNRNINVSYFASFGGVLANSRYDKGEYNIYNLINLSKFDAAILMTNTIGSTKERNGVIEAVRKSGMPAVVFDCNDYPEFYNIKIDNFTAMVDMVRHIVNDHGIKCVNYISGPLANPEAFERYRAFLSVMEENNIPIDNRRIYMGEFRGVDGKKAVSQFINSDMKMPGAIICANDAMAISAISALEKHGYSVPQDILVTGFDNTYKARNYSPEISSVSRPLYDAGAKACEIIEKLLAGEVIDKTTVLQANSVFSESCGCVSVELVDGFDEYKKKTFRGIDACNSHISILNRMTTNLAEAVTIDGIMEIVGGFVEELSCEKFYVCLCSDWQSTLREDDKNVDESSFSTYSKTMTAPLVWEDGSVRNPIPFFKLRDMHPTALQGGGNVSYFLPIHFRERCLGYCIIMNSDFPIKSMLCHTIVMNISNSIENIRKLYHLNNAIEELDKLYVIDPLCNIYNRNGFIRESDPLFKAAMQTGHKVMIAFIDMDGLKMINDNYGHKEGDFAIQKLASIISECCMENCICARFGGDEFIFFGYDVDEEEGEEIKKRIIQKIADINKIIYKPYEISASMGFYIGTASEDMTLFKMITKADEIMYEQKKRKKNSRYLRRN